MIIEVISRNCLLRCSNVGACRGLKKLPSTFQSKHLTSLTRKLKEFCDLGAKALGFRVPDENRKSRVWVRSAEPGAKPKTGAAETNTYLTFMRARRSATEVSFSILGSLVPNV